MRSSMRLAACLLIASAAACSGTDDVTDTGLGQDTGTAADSGVVMDAGPDAAGGPDAAADMGATDAQGANAGGDAAVQDMGNVDAQPGDAQPVDAMPGDVMPADAMPGDGMPADAMPGDAMPGDTGNDAGDAGNDAGDAGNDAGDAGDGGNDAGDAGDAGDGGDDAGDAGDGGNDAGDAGDAGDGGNDAGDAGDGGNDAGDAGGPVCDVIVNLPETNAGQVGAPGGSVGPLLTCPAGQEIIGVAVRMSDANTANGARSAVGFTAICAALSFDANGPAVGPETLQEAQGNGQFGWTPATQSTLTRCPAGWLASGLMGSRGAGGNLFYDITLSCSQLLPNGTTSGMTQDMDVLGSLPAVGATDIVACAAGEVVRRIGTRIGAGFDQASVFCGTPTCGVP